MRSAIKNCLHGFQATADPKLHSDAKLIERIDGNNIENALAGAGGSTKTDVTGGMESKLEYLRGISKDTGAICQIVNIAEPGRLYSAVSGAEMIGTIIRI